MRPLVLCLPERTPWLVVLLLTLSCGDDRDSRKNDAPPGDKGGSPAAGNKPWVPTATAGATAISAAGSEYFDEPRKNNAGSGDIAGAGVGGATPRDDAEEEGGTAGSAGSAGVQEAPAAGEIGGSSGSGGTAHTGGTTVTPSTGGTTTTGSCSAMVDKKARLCGLDDVGIQLANMGYCDICSDAGEARWVACMAGATTCAEAEGCGCLE